MFGSERKSRLPAADEALPGREAPIPVSAAHFVHGRTIVPPFPAGVEQAMFGMGCFWGAEKQFWQQAGVFSTAVGYSAGLTPNPSYEEVCSGLTGHNEVVLLMFEPQQCSYETLLQLFWENHNPTQGMRQGNDTGTQYRSGIYVFSEAQERAALASRVAFQAALTAAGHGDITTEIQAAEPFYYAEEYHQQYLAKNPAGYCGLGGTGVQLSGSCAS